MASIDKLLIKGVRSFNPDLDAVIKFYMPLTIIVGQNGAGKTTIIEALKYATTGDMPPNSKGGAFIHDPKLIRRSEVLAQVRLRFYNVNGDTLEAFRSIQLTQKKTTATLKTLEAVLFSTNKETKESKSVTLKAAELDEDMSRNLGVSKAILDNVIFCHQEESNWPLSDSSTLKKRFDEIFSSTSYSKFLETLRKKLKEENSQLKEFRLELKLKLSDRDKSHRLRAEITEIETLIEESSKKIEFLTKKLEEVTATIKGLAQGAEEQQKVVTQLALLDREIQNKKDLILNIKKEFEELPLDLEALKRMQREHGVKEEDTINAKAETESTYSHLSQQLNQKQDRLRSMLSQQGKARADFENFERARNAMNDITKELHSALDQGDSPKSDILLEADNNLIELKEKLIFQIGINEEEAVRIREESRTRQKKINDQLQDLKIQENQLAQILRISKKRKEESFKNLNEVKIQLVALSQNVSGTDALKAELLEKEEDLKDFKSQIDKSQLTDNIGAKKLELSEHEELLYSASQTPNASTSDITSESQFKLAYKTKERETHFSKALKLIEANTRVFGKYIESPVAPHNAGFLIPQAISSKRRAIQDKLSLIEELQNKLVSFESRYTIIQSLLSKKQAEITDFQSKIQSICGCQEFVGALSQSETVVREKEIQLYRHNGIESVYNKFLGKSPSGKQAIRQNAPKRAKLQEQCSESNNTPISCPLCNNTFETESNATNFMRDLADKHLELHDEIRDFTLELQRAKNRRDELQNLSPVWEHLTRLKRIEIPQLEKEQRQNAEQVIEFREKLGCERIELDRAQLELSDLEKVLSPAFEIKFLNERIIELDEEIKKIPQPSDRGTPPQNETAQLASQCKQLKIELANLIEEHETTISESLRREKAVQLIKDRLCDLENNNQESIRLQCLVESLEADISLADDNSKATEKDLNQIEPKITALQEDLDLIISSTDTFIMECQTRLNYLINLQTKLNSIESTMQEYERQAVQSKLDNVSRTIGQYEEQIAETKSAIEKNREQIKSLEADILNDKKYRKNITQNISYQENKLSLAKTEKEHLTLRQQYQNNSHEKLQEELISKRENQNTLISKRAGLQGELRQMEVQVQRNKNELEVNFKDIDEEYRLQAHQLVASELKSEDLEVYCSALEKAIMKYHSTKMAEINKIIQELWANTYYGTDIETVRIKSDAEKLIGNRSYNYRVVMVKDGIELDMRGRCSAGQKVLTSIIIRLALAEAFGTSCGVLALDEPTTNLDRDNIKSLARSLVSGASIIESRRSQRNFQLVIITHDEEFTAELGRSDYTDYYWVVSKEQGRSSVIKRKDIADLF